MTVATLITASLSGTFLAAIVTAGTSAIVTMKIARQKSREEERSRVRTICAEAFEVVATYKELPYAMRRRRHDQPETERFRLRTHPDVAARYAALKRTLAAVDDKDRPRYRAGKAPFIHDTLADAQLWQAAEGPPQ